MPLYKTITVNPQTKVFIWKIDESLDELMQDLKLTPFCLKRLESVKSIIQKKQFLCVRHLLRMAGFDERDMHYDANGKPHLVNDQYISVTHSYEFAGIIVSSQPAGIDIEKQRDKILRIAERFTPLQEYRTLANHEAIIRKLTIVWGAKESIYKTLNINGISFRDNIDVEDFDFDETNSTTAEAHHRGKTIRFDVKFFEFEGFTCVYTLSSKPL